MKIQKVWIKECVYILDSLILLSSKKQRRHTWESKLNRIKKDHSILTYTQPMFTHLAKACLYSSVSLMIYS